MQYRHYNQQADELKRRIEEVERDHYLTALDKIIAEKLRDDNRLLMADDRLRSVEALLKILYDIQGKNA